MELIVTDIRMYFSIYAMLRVSTMLVSSFKDRNIRRKHSYFGQERFWLIKGWTYKEQNKLVPFSQGGVSSSLAKRYGLLGVKLQIGTSRIGFALELGLVRI